MRKLFTVVLVMSMLLPAAALADLPDISGLSFDELVQLKDQLNISIWNSEEWQEVTVPAGVWIVGEDIPAGHWTIRPLPNDYVNVTYFDKIDQFGKDVAPGWIGWGGCLTSYGEGSITYGELTEVDLIMEPGMYFKCGHTVIFTPYSGKPSLGFN